MSRNQMDMMAAESAPAIDQLRAQGMQAATELQDVKDETMIMQVPPGKYSAKALQQFTQALNKALELFKAPPLPMPESDLEGELPLDHVKALLMVNAAISDAGIGEPIDLQKLTDDKGLKLAAGRLDAAAKDKAFKSYLAKPMDTEVEITMETEEVPEGMHSMPDGSLMKDEDMDEEELMMSRMR